jgi:allantoin racemase
MTVILVNPNTSQATTDAMVALARAETTHAVRGLTARSGAALITDPPTLEKAALAVAALAPDLAGARAVIVAAFGDPGLAALRGLLTCPVTGIAEAGMAEAAAISARFAVVTTTPLLAPAIAAKAAADGHAGFAGTWVTPGDPAALMADPARLVDALHEACRRAVQQGGAGAIVIGGGPLAMAARALAGRLPVPLVEPVPAAVRLTLSRLRSRPEPEQ